MRYAFGDFELYDDEGAPPDRGRLTRRGEPLAVRRKVLALITLLIRKRRRVVHRRELVNQLWPDVQVGESSLSTALNEARSVLDDTGARQRWIRTLPGRGYRFEGQVELRRAPGAEALEPALLERRLDELLVGRSDVLRIAEDALEAPASAERPHLLLCGPLGAGRTRLTVEVAAMASGRGWAVHSGRCEPGDDVPPLWPFSQILVSLCDQGAAGVVPGPSHRRELGSVACDAPVHAATVGLAARQLRFHQFEAIRRDLRDGSELRPTLVVLEDLHYADAASLLCLRHLVRASGCGQLLMLATLRDAPASGDALARRRLAELATDPGLLRVPLAPLSLAATRELAIHGGLADWEGERLRTLHRRSGGNPLFLRELIRAAAAAATDTDAGIRLIPSPELRARMKELVLDNLPPDGRALALSASALRGPIPLELLATLAQRSKRATLALLEPLERTGLLLPGMARAAEWHWAHPLVAEALHASLAPLERARVEERIARARSRSWAGPGRPRTTGPSDADRAAGATPYGDVD